MRFTSLWLVVALMCGIAPAQVPESDPLYVVIVNDRRGWIDRNGKIVIPTRFDGVREFSEGLAAVWLLDKAGFINRQGNMVITPQFYSATYFSEGRAPVSIDVGVDKYCPGCRHKELWGYVDRAGSLVVKPQYQSAGDFSGGLAPVQNRKGKWGYIDSTGNVAIKFRFKYASKFSDRLALVELVESGDTSTELGNSRFGTGIGTRVSFLRV